MDNTELPAYPLPIALHHNGTLNTTLDVDSASIGFTKLELASLMIAQGFAAYYDTYVGDSAYAEMCLRVAKAVLEEANK